MDDALHVVPLFVLNTGCIGERTDAHWTFVCNSGVEVHIRCLCAQVVVSWTTRSLSIHVVHLDAFIFTLDVARLTFRGDNILRRKPLLSFDGILPVLGRQLWQKPNKLAVHFINSVLLTHVFEIMTLITFVWQHKSSIQSPGILSPLFLLWHRRRKKQTSRNSCHDSGGSSRI